MGKDLNILYEDNHLIVVEKPFNVLSQADDTKDIDMLTIVKNYLKEKYNKPGNVYLGLVHRLDRPTGGIMVFAKTSKAASRLSKDIRENKFTKKYLAVVHGKLKEPKGVLENYLLKNSDNTSIVTDEKHGKYAKLSYEMLDYKNNLTLVSITLETGRHHQIRVQFANIKNPLYGDQRYGSNDKKQLALYAYYLSFNHPVTKEKLEFINFPKKEGIWGLFIK
ncbi:MAG: RluA family pseudouridine synthase [bacterium]|nr:RluA family pseudouridine synthase [bacterium]